MKNRTKNRRGGVLVFKRILDYFACDGGEDKRLKD